MSARILPFPREIDFPLAAFAHFHHAHPLLSSRRRAINNSAFSPAGVQATLVSEYYRAISSYVMLLYDRVRGDRAEFRQERFSFRRHPSACVCSTGVHDVVARYVRTIQPCKRMHCDRSIRLVLAELCAHCTNVSAYRPYNAVSRSRSRPPRCSLAVATASSIVTRPLVMRAYIESH